MSTATVPTQHPIGIYFKIWGLLFVLSAFSYAVDFFHVQGYLRWTLILLLMAAKAGLIVAYFMHLKWERLALIYTIVIPPTALLVLVWLMMVEGDHTFLTRMTHFG
ncbi:cytochrome C oxidase subunit IV [Massilia sp. Root418]|uniref:cytochrome C oxidase subunit IV family protein n=1 Tax=Massilia sp. Root418 TaxID=1736532 RepID=UPI0006F7B84C|nr:cytochrome C oxidase subunit IV family protein [Massilia sp. Root418]KQW93756.1 cytochrome C oxidase subunit IV [Massilia sp. Root418]